MTKKTTDWLSAADSSTLRPFWVENELASRTPARSSDGTSPWHRRFRVQETYSADFRDWHGAGIDELRNVYARLRPHLFCEEP